MNDRRMPIIAEKLWNIDASLAFGQILPWHWDWHPFGPKKFTRFSASTSRTSRLRRLSPSRQVTMSASPGLAVITTCRDVTIRAMWGNFQYSPAE